MHGAGLAVRVELLGDPGTDCIHLSRHDRRNAQSYRIRERRDPNARGEGRRLVVHVNDIGLPVAPGALNDARFNDVQHVRIAVVVVPDVLLIQLHRTDGLVLLACLAPVDDDVLPVGIDRRPEEEHDVVEDRLVARLVGVEKDLVGELRRVLRPGDLRCVQAAADVDDHLGVASKPVCLGVGEPFGMREAHVGATDLIDTREVLGRRDESDGNRPAKCGLSDLDQLDAIARRGEAPEVGDRLLVVEELVVGADGEAKRRFRSRQRLLGLTGP